tara:strand:- start:277 stop:789 length:513 start_codon:yes stop_codon:yes gene_type:complete
MKKLLLILLCLPLLFSTCKKEEEDPVNTNSNNNLTSLIGKWNMKIWESEYNEICNGVTLSENEIYYFDDVDNDLQPYYHLDFKANEEVKITSFTEGALGGDSVYSLTAPYYVVNELDLYVTAYEWPFDMDNLWRPIKINLLDNNSLHFTKKFYRNGGSIYGDNKFIFERL